METYDDAAFERFCGGLVNAGFSPVRDTAQQHWTGPVRASLKPLTPATRMEVVFYPGWPLRYAHVRVDGLAAEHAANGTICLWAEDDPAQIAGRDLDTLWSRLDHWAETAQRGFGVEDRALDAYLLFANRCAHRAELPLADFVRAGSNGYRASLVAVVKGKGALMIESASATTSTDQDGGPPLRGAFYLRGRIGDPPRTLDDVRAALTRRQAEDLARGLDDRSPAGLAEPSGGYDFIVLAWPRHDREHDAVVVAFEGRGDTLTAYAVAATANDLTARRRRAGSDAALLSGKTVLVAGAGSVGGHVVVALASSGVDVIRLHDSDYLTTANLVRHVSDKYGVGWKKTIAVAVAVADHAPWTRIEPADDLPHAPSRLATHLGDDLDLVIDCTGRFSVTAALAEMCRRAHTPLISGALFHQGALARVQRQAAGDTTLAARTTDDRYLPLPPETPSQHDSGFLELGCTAPVNNAPPTAVVATAADIAHAAVDLLTGRRNRADERVIVFRPLDAPFHRTGTLDSPHPGGTA